jgi:ABC-type polysaccharide transport system permease subunit
MTREQMIPTQTLTPASEWFVTLLRQTIVIVAGGILTELPVPVSWALVITPRLRKSATPVPVRTIVPVKMLVLELPVIPHTILRIVTGQHGTKNASLSLHLLEPVKIMRGFIMHVITQR